MLCAILLSGYSCQRQMDKVQLRAEAGQYLIVRVQFQEERTKGRRTAPIAAHRPFPTQKPPPSTSSERSFNTRSPLLRIQFFRVLIVCVGENLTFQNQHTTVRHTPFHSPNATSAGHVGQPYAAPQPAGRAGLKPPRYAATPAHAG